MKPIRVLFVTALLVGTAIAAVAAPPSKRTYTSSALRSEEDFAKLREGDKIALVCKECASVTVQTVENTAEAMKFCKEGETVVCGSCKMTAKVVRHGPPSKSIARSEVRYENAKGEECMFVVKLEN